MKINQIYYEELRSFLVDGKWTNRKFGIGASLNEENGKLSERLNDLQVIVKRELDRLDREIIGNDLDKYKKAFLENEAENIKREIELIDVGNPF